MEALLETLNAWATINHDAAYFIGFVLFCLIFYFLYPFNIGLSQSVSSDTPFGEMDVGRQVKKKHRPILLLCAVGAFAILHFGLGMPGMAIIIGSLAIGILALLDTIQIERDNPRRP